jgi:DNA-binding transcriptional LysR family regulator
MTKAQPVLRKSAVHHDMTDLRLLVAVADAGSVSLGAQRCHLAPSSASLRISGLEAAFGVALFQRLARGVRLTPAGQILLEHARASLAQLEQVRVELAPLANGYGAPVSLMANSNAIASFLPQDLPGFLVAHPHARLMLEERTSAQIVTAVVSGRADLGIVAWDGEHPALRFAPYRMDELVLVVAPGHALARRREVRFAECAMLPFVGLPSGSAIHTFLMERSSELGLTLDVRVQVWGFAAVCGLVAAGVGVAVVPRSVTVGDTATLDVVTLAEPWARRQLRLCVRADRVASPIADALVCHLQAQGAGCQ